MLQRMNSLNINSISPSFKGIVKVSLVFDGDKPSTDKKVIDSAARQLKAILMKKTDSPEDNENNDKIRKIYNYFDNDYVIPAFPPQGDARDAFTKVRTGKYGNEVYLVSGNDAAIVSSMGKNIGDAESQEKTDESNTEHVQQAKDKYHAVKKTIASKYYRSERRPNIFLYTVRDKKNIPRLIAVRMNDLKNYGYCRNEYMQTININQKYLNEINSEQNDKGEKDQPKILQNQTKNTEANVKEKNPSFENTCAKPDENNTSSQKPEGKNSGKLVQLEFDF